MGTKCTTWLRTLRLTPALPKAPPNAGKTLALTARLAAGSMAGAPSLPVHPGHVRVPDGLRRKPGTLQVGDAERWLSCPLALAPSLSRSSGAPVLA